MTCFVVIFSFDIQIKVYLTRYICIQLYCCQIQVDIVMYVMKVLFVSEFESRLLNLTLKKYCNRKDHCK